MAEMLNCPLCKNIPELVDLAGWEINCSCGINFCTNDGDRNTTVAAWNRRTTPPQAAGGEPVASDGPCSDEDGCPTEGAVLKRFWRTAMALANGWQDEAAATWGESKEHATLQRCCDELRLAGNPAQPAGGDQ